SSRSDAACEDDILAALCPVRLLDIPERIAIASLLIAARRAGEFRRLAAASAARASPERGSRDASAYRSLERRKPGNGPRALSRRRGRARAGELPGSRPPRRSLPRSSGAPCTAG